MTNDPNKKYSSRKKAYRGHTLRKGRHSAKGCVYLLTTVTWNRRCLFSDWRIGRLVAQSIREAEEHGLAKSYAWVVMPDHFHWLAMLGDCSLGRLMQSVKSRSAIAVNRINNQDGKVWQSGYYDHALRHEENLKDAARYIIANPLRVGLVKRIGDYPLWDAVWLSRKNDILPGGE